MIFVRLQVPTSTRRWTSTSTSVLRNNASISRRKTDVHGVSEAISQLAWPPRWRKFRTKRPLPPERQRSDATLSATVARRRCMNTGSRRANGGNSRHQPMQDLV